MLSLKLKNLFGDFYTKSGTMGVMGISREPAIEPEDLVGPAWELWQIMIADGWSRERFLVALDGFVRQKHYGKDSWAPFDFLHHSVPPDLHDERWMIEHRMDGPIESFQGPDGRSYHRFVGSGKPLPSEFIKIWPRT